MITQILEKTDLQATESYQFIKDEHLSSVVISSQVLAGSRVLLSSYSQVVFSDCVFYACDFQGVSFENCVFENCTFEFSHIRKCKFKNCNFESCNWVASSSTNSIYEDCDLDAKLTEMTYSNGNRLSFAQRKDHTTDIYIEFALVA